MQKPDNRPERRATPEYKAYQAEYQKRPERKAYKAAWGRAPGAQRHRKNLNLKKYGISVDEFDQMLVQQGGRCANPACRTDKPGGPGGFHVDHCHSTGIVRGLLCNGCNTAAGLVKDDPDRLRGLADYLESHAKS